jgi:hypothetical protein
MVVRLLVVLNVFGVTWRFAGRNVCQFAPATVIATTGSLLAREFAIAYWICYFCLWLTLMCTLFLLNRFPHDDGTCTSHLSAYTPPSSHSTPSTSFGTVPYHLPRSYLSVGAESGVVSVFGADRNGLTGGYDFTLGGANASAGGVPKQLKSVMNLTTPITSSCFHPSGQILAIASNQVCDVFNATASSSHCIVMSLTTVAGGFTVVCYCALSPTFLGRVLTALLLYIPRNKTS